MKARLASEFRLQSAESAEPCLGRESTQVFDSEVTSLMVAKNAAGAGKQPSPSRLRSIAGKIAIVVGVAAAVIVVVSAVVKVVLFFNGMSNDITRLDSRLSQALDPQNAHSIPSAFANNTRHMTRLATTLFKVGNQLAKGKTDLAAISTQQTEFYGTLERQSQLRPPFDPLPNPQRLYAQPSRVPGMLAIILPPEHLGKSVPVLAMTGGKVLRIETEKDGSKVLDVAQEYGYRHRYGNLSDVTVAQGASVAQGHVIGRVTPTPGACLRVGILDPEGRFIDVRSFLPPMREPPPTQK